MTASRPSRGGAARAALRISTTTSAFAGLVIFGLMFTAIGVLDSIALTLAALFFGGFGRLMFTASAEAVLALGVAQHHRGLIGSLYALAFTGTTPLGALLITTLAQEAGTGVTMIVCGVAAIGGALVYAVLVQGHRPVAV